MHQYIDGYYNGVPSYRKINNDNNDNKENYNYVGNIITGIKWECIEFVRRYFVKRYHMIFVSVKNVYDMINLKDFFDFLNFEKVPLKLFKISDNYKPKIDDIVLFNYEDTGHVAIISNLTNISNIVEICEQNWEKPWENKNYSRKICINNSNIIGFFCLYNK